MRRILRSVFDFSSSTSTTARASKEYGNTKRRRCHDRDRCWELQREGRLLGRRHAQSRLPVGGRRSSPLSGGTVHLPRTASRGAAMRKMCTRSPLERRNQREGGFSTGNTGLCEKVASWRSSRTKRCSLGESCNDPSRRGGASKEPQLCIRCYKYTIHRLPVIGLLYP